MTKTFDFRFRNRFEFDDTELEFTSAGTVRQFKTAQGRNILRGTVPTTDNPSIPTATLQRLTDGNPSNPFRHRDVTTFTFTLPAATRVKKIAVKHEVGTQPYAVIVATSTDGITYDILYNNDRDNYHGLGIGTDPAFVATETGLFFDLNSQTATFLHVWTAGSISTDSATPSSNETRISEVELYESVYSGAKPELRTRETARLTLFNALATGVVEGENNFLQWRVVVGGKDMWYDGVDWVDATEHWNWNTTAELDANIDQLFVLPTMYEVGFAMRFVSEVGDNTAELTELMIDFENDAGIKATTTTVFLRTASGVGGQPDTSLYVTAQLEFGNRTNVTSALTGSDSRVVFESGFMQPAGEQDKVDSNGVWRKELIPNSIMTTARSQYLFNFWRKHPKNDKKFVLVGQIAAEVPKVNKYDLGTEIVSSL